MADFLETIQKLINSPSGQLAAGGVLAGIVWKFFERVEAVLNEDTKAGDCGLAVGPQKTQSDVSELAGYVCQNI